MKNIVLIGMPGAGKSTIGVLLAKALNMFFIDTDLFIQKKENKRLQEIIKEKGIHKFLTIEEDIVLGLNTIGSVIATGGSVILSKKAMNHLKSEGLIIYLKLPYKEIEKRIYNITTRGIAMDKDKTLSEVYDERVPLYEKYADKTVLCFGKSIEETVRDIIALWKEV